MSYLDLLPDDVYRLIAEYTHADLRKELCSIIKPREYNFLTHHIFNTFKNVSDYIRCQSLNNSSRRFMTRHIHSDWYKLLIDLESPVCRLTYHGLKSRRCKVYDVSATGEVWWNSVKQPPRLSYAGWIRLTDKP